jgi:hypothetical protein
MRIVYALSNRKSTGVAVTDKGGVVDTAGVTARPTATRPAGTFFDLLGLWIEFRHGRENTQYATLYF